MTAAPPHPPSVYAARREATAHQVNRLSTVRPVKVTEIKKSDYPAFPCPIEPADWPTFWKHGEWNEIKARITGNPPTITTWIKGVKFMHFTDDKKRHVDEGGIALQVHGGGDYTKQFVRYRNIRVKELKK